MVIKEASMAGIMWLFIMFTESYCTDYLLHIRQFFLHSRQLVGNRCFQIALQFVSSRGPSPSTTTTWVSKMKFSFRSKSWEISLITIISRLKRGKNWIGQLFYINFCTFFVIYSAYNFSNLFGPCMFGFAATNYSPSMALVLESLDTWCLLLSTIFSNTILIFPTWPQH